MSGSRATAAAADRTRHSQIPPDEFVKDSRKGALVDEHDAVHRCPFSDTVIADLRNVLTHDVWKGEAAGKHWARSWLKWSEPHHDGHGDYRLGRTEERRRANTYWYFGEMEI